MNLIGTLEKVCSVLHWVVFSGSGTALPGTRQTCSVWLVVWYGAMALGGGGGNS